jgi:transposase
MIRETITLTPEQQRRLIVLTQVREGRVAVTRAAPVLGLSVRQIYRLLARFRDQGAAALIHGNQGRRPANKKSTAVQRQVVRLAQTRYAGFNHSHLTEYLVEQHALALSRATVSRWLVAAGSPSPRPRRRRRFYRRRERMPQAGLLLQWDGSQHDWLEGRGPRLVLQGAIDDATNDVPAALFRLQEDAYGYLVVLRDLVRTRGIPVALYGDRTGILTNEVRPRPLTVDEQLQGRRRPLTQVGRALADLKIQWIPAHSPQAKGRIERLWGTFQDRLVSELRLAKARTLAQANVVLQTFLPRYNARFTRPAAQPGSGYRPLPAAVNLDDLCCFAYERTVANDNTVTLGPQRFQLLPAPHRTSYAQARAILRQHLDGTVSVHVNHQPVRFQLLSATSGSRRAQLHVSPPSRVRAPRRPSTWAPGPDHPWKAFDRRTLLKNAGIRPGDIVAEP